MKTAQVTVALASTLLLLASPSAAFAGVDPPPGVIPEPAAVLVWAGLAGAGGVAYWLRNRRRS